MIVVRPSGCPLTPCVRPSAGRVSVRVEVDACGCLLHVQGVAWSGGSDKSSDKTASPQSSPEMDPALPVQVPRT